MPEPLDLGNLGLDSSNPPSETVETNPDSLANPFLEAVDPNDREIVSKYINQWDGQVTKKFQDLRGQLKQYEDLGVDYDYIQHAVQTLNWANQDPVEFYNQVKQALLEMELLDEENNGTPPVGTNTLPEFEGLNPQFAEKFQTLEKELNDLREFKSNIERERTERTQQQQLDDLLSKLENDHGKFDQDAVLGRMLKGMSPEDAVKDWQKMMKEFNTPERRTPPPTLSGGRTAVEQVDTSKLADKKTRKSLVTDLLRNIDS